MQPVYKGLLPAVLLLLFMFYGSCVYAQSPGTCNVDASIENTNYKKDFTYCNFSNSGGEISVKFDIQNTSTTKATNKSYHIAWGDGTENTYGQDFALASHTYKTTVAKNFDLILTVTGIDGSCQDIQREKVFIGSNPGIGLENTGGNFSCAPATFTFKVTSIAQNPPSTEYVFQFDDGTAPFTRTHAELLQNPIITHTFTKSSGDKVDGFQLYARATNDCSYSTSSWSGIRISTGPVADIGETKVGTCINQEIILEDKTKDGYDGSGNTLPHLANWEVSPATGWTMTEKDGIVKIIFTAPDKYKVKLSVYPEDQNSTCNGSSKEKEFNIVAPPEANFTLLPSPENGCVNNAISVSNSSTGESVAWSWAVTNAAGQPVSGWGSFASGTNATSKEPKFNFTKPGDYKITLTANNGCAPSTKTEDITIKGKPTVTLPAAQAYCDTQTITFNTANAKHKPTYNANFGTIIGYKWEVKIISGQGDFAFENSTSSSSQYPVINFKTPAVYEVWAYATNDCGESSAPAKQRITINPLPDLKITAAKPALCIGESTTLTATGANTYTWAPATGLSATTGATVTANPTKTTTYTVTGKNTATGCTSTTTIEVVVNPLPVVSISSPSTEICLGQGTATLTASGADTYTWSPALGLDKTDGNVVTASPAATTTYTVTGINAQTGCSNTATVTVTVNPLPEVDAGPNRPVCDNPTPLKLQGSPAGGTWSGEHVSTDGTFIPNGKGDFILTYTYANAKGCTNSDKVTITVTEVMVADAGEEQAFCLNSGPQVLSGATPAGGAWSGEHVSSDGTFTPAAVGTFTLTYTYYTGTCFTSDEVEITVKPLPGKPKVTDQPVYVCYNTGTTLQAEAPEAGITGSFAWYDNNGKLLGTRNSLETGLLKSSTDFFVEFTSGQSSCTSERSKISVIVRPEIAMPVVSAPELCESGKAIITVTGTNIPTEYNWYDKSGTFIIKGGKTYEPELAAPGNYIFYAEPIVGDCTGPRAEVKVTVLTPLANSLKPVAAPICAGQEVTISGAASGSKGAGSYTYRWEISSNGTSFSTQTGLDPKQATYTYKAPANATGGTVWIRRTVISDNKCTSAPATVEVVVRPALVNQLQPVAAICAGDVPASIKGTVSGGSGEPYKYTWWSKTEGGVYQKIADADETSSTYQPKVLQNSTWYKRVVISEPCASSESEVLVTVRPAITKNTISINPTTFCEGDDVTILGSSPEGGEGTGSYTYVWYSIKANGTTEEIARGKNLQNLEIKGITTSATYRRVVISGACTVPSTSNDVRIEVNPKIVNVISADQEICMGSNPVKLESKTPVSGGDGRYTYVWEYKTEKDQNFKTAPGAFNLSNGTYQPGTLTENTWFRRKVTSGACTSYSLPVYIKVNELIANYQIKDSQSIYEGDKPAPLTDLGPKPAGGGNGKLTFRWEYSTDAGTNKTFRTADVFTSNYTGRELVFEKGVYSTTWFRRVAMSGGCEVVSDPIVITVVGGIKNNIILQSQSICMDNVPDLLRGTKPEGGVGNPTYVWLSSTVSARKGFVTAQGYNGSPNNGQDFQPGAINRSTWFRRLVTTGAYKDTSEAVLITVNQPLSNNKILASARTICSGDTPDPLTASKPTGGSGEPAYMWEYSNTRDGIYKAAPGANNKQDYSPYPLTETTWFRRVVTSASCGSLVSAPVEVNVLPLPLAPVAANAAICGGQTATLTAKGQGGGKLEWYASAAGGKLQGAGDTFTTPVLDHTTTFYVQEVQSCTGPRTEVTVTVSEATAYAGEDVTVVMGRSAELYGSGGVTYSWSPAAGLNNPNIANPVATPDVTTTYTLTVVTAGGCTFTDEITVTVLPFVDVPNTFTPNRDGINDTWEIANIEKYPNCQVQVFNQWGNMVFSSIGYGEKWNGLFKGQELPLATYYYIIHLDKTEKPLSGSITIVK